MSKYDKLWTYIENCGQPELLLSFDEIAEICETMLTKRIVCSTIK